MSNKGVPITIDGSGTVYNVPIEVKRFLYMQNKTFMAMREAMDNVEKSLDAAFEEGYKKGKKSAQKVFEEGIDLTPPPE